MRSYNDDLVMALSIGCWIRDTALQVNKRDVEYKKAMLDSMYMSKSIMNTAIKGMTGHEKTQNEKISDFKEEMSAFPWIYKG